MCGWYSLGVSRRFTWRACVVFVCSRIDRYIVAEKPIYISFDARIVFSLIARGSLVSFLFSLFFLSRSFCTLISNFCNHQCDDNCLKSGGKKKTNYEIIFAQNCVWNVDPKLHILCWHCIFLPLFFAAVIHLSVVHTIFPRIHFFGQDTDTLEAILILIFFWK